MPKSKQCEKQGHHVTVVVHALTGLNRAVNRPPILQSKPSQDPGRDPEFEM